MTTFELDYIKSESLPQRHQLSTIFNSTIEEVFETLEAEDVDMSTVHYMIETIVNRDFGNQFQHHNGPNQRQQIHKSTSRQYLPIYYQKPRTSSIPHLKKYCLGCGINNKGTRDLLMQHDGKLETCSFRGPLFTKEESAREQLLKNNNKNGSRHKYFNKNTDTSNTALSQDTIDFHPPKVNSVCFEEPYDHINRIWNTHDYTHIIDAKEQNREDDDYIQE